MSFERSKSNSKSRLANGKGKRSQGSGRSFTHSPETTRKSGHYYSDLKKKIFKAIFDQLDSSKSGQISNDNLNIDALDLEVVKIMSPIFDEIDQKKLTLNKKGFYKNCAKLYDKLDPSRRNIILKYKQHH